MSRAEKLNERYHERTNTPNYGEFTGLYHFKDKEGRHYMIAEKNEQTFQKQNLLTPLERQKKRIAKINKHRQCDFDNATGQVRLFVKLPSKEIQWFNGGRHFRAEKIVLFPSSTAIAPDPEYEVRLMSDSKPSYARRTGTIFIKGLSKELCNTLLNQ